MTLYDEKKAVEAIRELPKDVKLHLSHVVRNGMMVVMAKCHLGINVEEAFEEFEKKWKDLGL